MFDVTCLGEALIDLFSLEQGRSLAEISAFRPQPGGAPANVAVAAARLGARSAFLGKVGDDLFGHYLVEALREQGVETRGMRFDTEARTGLNFHLQIDEQSSTHLFYRHPSADMRLRRDELDRSIITHTRAFAFGSISLIQEPSRSATRKALALARASGAFAALDVNYRPALWAGPEAFRQCILEIAPQVDVLKLNLEEARLLSHAEQITEIMERLSLLPCKLCVVTMGSAGCTCGFVGRAWMVPGFSVQAQEATGCGDAFMAALTVQLAALEDWRVSLAAEHLWEMARLANAAGSLASLKAGVFAALPTRSEVEQFLAQHLLAPVQEIGEKRQDSQEKQRGIDSCI